MMTKRCYAAIMTAKDMSARIKELTDEVKAKGVTKAYKAVMEIAEMNDKYFADFQSVDPAWTPDSEKAKKNAAQTGPAKAPAYTPAPAYAYAEEDLPVE